MLSRPGLHFGLAGLALLMVLPAQGIAGVRDWLDFIE